MRDKRLKTTYALMGASSIFGQALVLRELMCALRGNELAVAVSLGVWMVSVGIASSAGGRYFAGRFVGHDLSGFRITASVWLLLIALLMPVAVVAPRFLLPAMGFPSGELVPAYATFALITFTVIILTPVIGSMFPLCAMAAGKDTEGAATVYAYEALGYFAAGLLFTFVAAVYLTPLQCAGVLGAVLALASLWLAAGTRGRAAKYVSGALAAFTLAASLTLIYTGDSLGLASLRASQGSGETVEARWSKYGVVTVVSLEGQYSVFENGAYAFSVPSPDFVDGYVHMKMLSHQDPKDVLMVGGGGGMAKVALEHPVTHLDYAELDPVMIEVYGDYAGPLEDPRLHVHHIDGRRLIKSKRGEYDLIMINLGEPSTASVNRYYTEEFFGEAKAALRRGGVLALSLPSSEGYIGSEKAALLGSTLATLRTVFPQVFVTPGPTAHFFASAEAPVERLDAGTLVGRYKTRGIRDPEFDIHDIEYAMMPGESGLLMDRIEAAGGVVNRDFRPLAYMYALGLWGEMAGLPLFDRINTLAGMGPNLILWAALPVLAVLLLLYGFRRGSGRTGAFYTVATTGITGMSVEVSGLLAYQSCYGYLYDMIGALMASFMLGLFIGGITGRRVISSGGFSVRTLIGVDVSVILLACMTALLATYPPGGWLFGAAVFAILVLAGGLTGLQYPLSLELASRSSAPEKAAANAGAVYGFDLMGAGLGSVAAGLVLVPLLGIAYTALCMVILKISSSVFLLTCRRA